MKLQSLSLSGGIVLAWSNPSWITYILPSDSIKKRLIHMLVRFPLSWILFKPFNGRLNFGGQSIDLETLFSQVADNLSNPVVSAVFINSRRDPPRVYIWLKSDGVDYFIKIGLISDYPAFANEFKVLKRKKSIKNVRIMSPLKLYQYGSLAILLFEGLTVKEHSEKQRVAPKQVLAHFSQGGVRHKGFFGGVVHGDLSSNNVFVLGDELLVLDWESSVESGPAYCDLIELGSALTLSDPVLEQNFERLRDILNTHAGFCPDTSIVKESLEYLSQKGNKNASQLLSKIDFFEPHNK